MRARNRVGLRDIDRVAASRGVDAEAAAAVRGTVLVAGRCSRTGVSPRVCEPCLTWNLVLPTARPSRPRLSAPGDRVEALGEVRELGVQSRERRWQVRHELPDTSSIENIRVDVADHMAEAAVPVESVRRPPTPPTPPLRSGAARTTTSRPLAGATHPACRRAGRPAPGSR